MLCTAAASTHFMTVASWRLNRTVISGHTLRSLVNISERLSCLAAAITDLSVSNIDIPILIPGVEEALNVVKMMRLAVSIYVLSVILAGNSITELRVATFSKYAD